MRSRVLALAALLAICAGFYWKLILTGQYTWVDAPDLVVMEIPRFQYQISQWHLLRFPLWDPHQWCGQPFLGQIVGAAFPLHWPFFLAGYNGGKISLEFLNWYYVLMHFFCAATAAWLCRDQGRSRAASLLGGCVYGLSAFLANNSWPQLLGAFVLAPVAVLFQLRAMRGQRALASAAVSGVFLGGMWLSGHHEVPIYFAMLSAGLWVWHLWRNRSDILVAATAGLFTALTSGFQTVPGFEYAKLAKRWAGAEDALTWNQPVPYFVHSQLSMPATSLFSLVIPWTYQQANLFIGVTALALAFLAVVMDWKDRMVRVFCAIALVGLLFGLGGMNVFHGLLYAVVPVFSKARVPARIISIFILALAVLAASGYDALLQRPSPVWLRRCGVTLVAVGGLIFTMFILAAAWNKTELSEYVAGFGLMALLCGSLLLAWRAGSVTRGVVSFAIFALVLLELGRNGQEFPNQLAKNSGHFVARLSRDRDVGDFLRAERGINRVHYVDDQGTMNFGDWEGVDMLMGFGAGVTSNLLRHEVHTPRTQILLAANYVYTKSKPANQPNLIPVMQGKSGSTLFRNPDALPRSWIVYRGETVEGEDALRRKVQDAGTDFRATALFLDQPPPELGGCSGGGVKIGMYQANRVQLDVSAACKGLVVLADVWYPGWRATVDGKRAPILETYGALRGVVVEPGLHRIDMRYRPASAYVGGAMTLAGVFGCLGLVWFTRRRG